MKLALNISGYDNQSINGDVLTLSPKRTNLTSVYSFTEYPSVDYLNMHPDHERHGLESIAYISNEFK